MSDIPEVPDLYPEFHDTPRTFWHRVVDGKFYIVIRAKGSPDMVGLAQQLERELNAANARIVDLEGKLKDTKAELGMFRIGLIQ